MKFKWIFLLFFIAIIVSGIFAFNADLSTDTTAQLADSTSQVLVADQGENPDIAKSALDKLTDNRTKSNLINFQGWK